MRACTSSRRAVASFSTVADRFTGRLGLTGLSCRLRNARQPGCPHTLTARPALHILGSPQMLSDLEASGEPHGTAPHDQCMARDRTPQCASQHHSPACSTGVSSPECTHPSTPHTIAAAVRAVPPPSQGPPPLGPPPLEPPPLEPHAPQAAWHVIPPLVSGLLGPKGSLTETSPRLYFLNLFSAWSNVLPSRG